MGCFLVEFKNAVKTNNKQKLIAMTVSESNFFSGKGGATPRDFFNEYIYYVGSNSEFKKKLKVSYIDYTFPNSTESERVVGSGTVEGGNLTFQYTNGTWLFSGVVDH